MRKDFCPECGLELYRPYGPKACENYIGCINPKCDNYYEKEKA